MKDPKAANEALGDGKAEADFQKSYRQFVSLPSAKEAFRKLFLALGDREELPTLFHCTTGKDRTGWAAAALLTLLGVDRLGRAGDSVPQALHDRFLRLRERHHVQQPVDLLEEKAVRDPKLPRGRRQPVVAGGPAAAVPALGQPSQVLVSGVAAEIVCLDVFVQFVQRAALDPDSPPDGGDDDRSAGDGPRPEAGHNAADRALRDPDPSLDSISVCPNGSGNLWSVRRCADISRWGQMQAEAPGSYCRTGCQESQ